MSPERRSRRAVFAGAFAALATVAFAFWALLSSTAETQIEDENFKIVEQKELTSFADVDGESKLKLAVGDKPVFRTSIPLRDHTVYYEGEKQRAERQGVEREGKKTQQSWDIAWDGRDRRRILSSLSENIARLPDVVRNYPESQFDNLTTVLESDHKRREEEAQRDAFRARKTAPTTSLSLRGLDKGQILELDYQNATHREYAEYLVDKEVPFVVRRVSSVVSLSQKWDASYFRNKMKGKTIYYDKSNFDRFMYIGKRKGPPGWVPPQEQLSGSVDDFLSIAEQSPESVKPTDTHVYWQVAGGQKGTPEYSWLHKDTSPFCAKQESNFFNLGGADSLANVRIGMAGNQAAMHFDSPPNFIFQAVGFKRYVLAPPSECPFLYLYNEGHPSSRHTAVDFNRIDLENYPKIKNAAALSTVLSPGDALYVPGNYYHHMESLEFNASVNCRSKVERRNGVTRKEAFNFCKGHYVDLVEYAKSPAIQ